MYIYIYIYRFKNNMFPTLKGIRLQSLVENDSASMYEQDID